MLIISQNLLRYELTYPENVVIRFNLAWVDDLNKLEFSISRLDNDIFIDLPVGRTKPPNNNYKMEDLEPIIRRNSNVKYLAISNVGSYEDIRKHVDLFHKQVCIVPKIETKKGVENISEICAGIIGEKIIMLDHDDLFSDLMKNNVPASKFFTYIEELVDFCNQNSVRLLKTRGVIFSDEDKYHF